MASATEQFDENYQGSTYYINNDPLDFSQYYNMNYEKDFNPNSNPYSLWNKIKNIFTGDLTSAEKAYDIYLNDWYDKRNQERANYANWKTQQREDSSVQRAREDYEKAGFSPYALISGGYSAPSSAYQFANRKGYDFNEKTKDSDKAISTAMKVLALVILKKALF